jgi:hypothetical protein
MRRRAASVFVAVLLIGTLLVGAAAPSVGQQSDTNTTTFNTTAADNKYSLSDLQQGGTTQAGAPDSMRFLGQYGSATLRHEPVGLGTDEWEYVDPGNTLVKRNHVTLRTIRLGDPDQNLTVHVVAWNRGTKTVDTQNGTTTQLIATNITERTVNAQLGRGYDNASIPLPRSVEEKQHITMWTEGYPDARWHFEHRSVATTQPISINSWGDFLSAMFWKFGIFALAAMFGAGWLARQYRERAIVGPQWLSLQWGALVALPVLGLSSAWAFQGALIATRSTRRVWPNSAFTRTTTKRPSGPTSSPWPPIRPPAAVCVAGCRWHINEGCILGVKRRDVRPVVTGVGDTNDSHATPRWLGKFGSCTGTRTDAGWPDRPRRRTG